MINISTAEEQFRFTHNTQFKAKAIRACEIKLVCKRDTARFCC